MNTEDNKIIIFEECSANISDEDDGIAVCGGWVCGISSCGGTVCGINC